MKYRIIILCLLSVVCSTKAQYRTSSTFQPLSFEKMAAPYEIYTNAYNKASAEINALKNFVANALGKNIDETLQRQLKYDFVFLNNISNSLRENGLDGVFDAIEEVKNDINNHVVAYNDRIKKAAKEYELQQQRIAEEKAKYTEPQNWTGSGFAINNQSIVTNYHVIADADTIFIRGVKGQFDIKYTATVIARDINNDIAIVRIEDNTFSGFGQIPYCVRTTMSEVGEDVFVLGYPLTSTMGEEIKLTTGVVSSRTGFQGDVSLYQITAPVQPGSSGGPLFDKDGNIIGIVSAKHTDAENAGYAIKTSYLKTMLENTSLPNILPTKNLVANKTLSEKVKKLKNYVFLIECKKK